MCKKILEKLDEVYLAKSLENRIYLKKRLYFYIFATTDQSQSRWRSSTRLLMILALWMETILTLNALPSSYDQLSDAIIYGKDKPITYTQVYLVPMMAKELQINTSKGSDLQAPEALNVKKFKNPKFKKKYEENSKASMSDTPKETRSFHGCKKPGHLKKDCFAWKRKQASEGKEQNTFDCVEGVDPPARF